MRMTQRGIRQELLDIALQYGEPAQDKVILGKKALQSFLDELQGLERSLLKVMDKGGIVVVTCDGQLITTYNLDSYSRRKARNAHRDQV